LPLRTDRRQPVVPLASKRNAVPLRHHAMMRARVVPRRHQDEFVRHQHASRAAAEQPIFENTLNAAQRRLAHGSEDMTTHGFRATASSRLNGIGRWNPDAIYRQLPHLEAQACLDVSMMHTWADYLDELREGGDVLR
jgi:integrase